jgi:DNA end-binding protein Ku
MPRALWKGAISFGLVHIPVALYPAAREHRVDFDWLDRKTMKPVGYKRVNKATGREVSKDDIVKGVEVSDGQYVLLGDEEIRTALPRTTQTVEILGFVEGGQIAPGFFERPYVLAPVARGEKVYVLLREALRKSGRIGIARVVVQTKQHLAVLFSDGDALRLNTLRWADELRSADDLGLPGHDKKNAPAARELEMAEKLIEQMSIDWKPERYEDHFRKEVLAMVDRKRAKRDVKEVEPVEAPANSKGADVIDLTELLKRSLQGRSAAPARAATKTAPRKKAAGAAGKRAA